MTHVSLPLPLRSFILGHGLEAFRDRLALLIQHGLFPLQPANLGTKPPDPSLLLGHLFRISTTASPTKDFDNQPIVSLLPTNIIFGLFLNQPDTLQNIGNVIDASLLHLQLVGCIVEIEDTVWGGPQQGHKLSCQQSKGIVVATGICRVISVNIVIIVIIVVVIVAVNSAAVTYIIINPWQMMLI